MIHTLAARGHTRIEQMSELPWAQDGLVYDAPAQSKWVSQSRQLPTTDLLECCGGGPAESKLKPRSKWPLDSHDSLEELLAIPLHKESCLSKFRNHQNP